MAEAEKPPINYPTVYTFKVMGLSEDGFAEFVRHIFHRAMRQEISPDSISLQPSSKGKYLSLSVSVYLLSEEQRQTIYAQLHKEKRILYYF